MGQGNTPVDDNGKPVLALWNDATGKAVPVHIGSTVTGSDGQTYAILDVNASVSPPASVVSTTNSSTTLLAANAVFTGTSESILPYGAISVQAYSDHASAASGLIIEQSQDGTNWDTQSANSVSAATAFQKTVNATGKFYRIVYTNGAADQTVFRLQTVKEVAASPSAGVANQRVNAQSGDFASGAIASGAVASGAIASGAVASGAVAAGAIAAGAYVSGSVLSGAFADGAVVGIGTTTQTKATDGTTTSWSVIQVLKGIFDKLLGTLAVTQSGTWTEANSAASKADLDTIVPGVQGWIAATGTGTTSQDNSFTFANQVRKVVLYNSAAVAVPFEFDQTSTANSFPIQPGQYMVFDDVLCTIVHVFPSATLTLNTAGGLYVKGWK